MADMTNNELHIAGPRESVLRFIEENRGDGINSPVELSFTKAAPMPEEYIPERWAEFHVNEWGTKSDGRDFTDWRYTDLAEWIEASITFDTPWSPPVIYLFTASEKYPELVFTLIYAPAYDEIQYWCSIGIKNGSIIPELSQPIGVREEEVAICCSDYCYQCEHCGCCSPDEHCFSCSGGCESCLCEGCLPENEYPNLDHEAPF